MEGRWRGDYTLERSRAAGGSAGRRMRPQLMVVAQPLSWSHCARGGSGGIGRDQKVSEGSPAVELEPLSMRGMPHLVCGSGCLVWIRRSCLDQASCGHT